MRKLLLTILLVGVTCFLGFSQSPYLDSLSAAYHTEADATRFKTLYRYCYGLMQFDVEKTSKLLSDGRQALNASQLPDAKKAFLNGLFSEVEASMAEGVGNHEESLRHYQKCFEYALLSEGLDQHLLNGLAYWGKGIHFGQQGFYEKSNVQLLNAKKAFSKAEQPGKEADVLAQLGQNYHQLQQYDSTILFVNEALELIDPVLDPFNQFYYNFFKANAFNELGKADSTISLLEDSYLEKAKSIMPILYAHLVLSRSDAHIMKQQFYEANRFLLLAKPLVDETDVQQLDHNYLLTNLKLEEGRKNYEKAYKALYDLKVFEDTLHQQMMDSKFMALQSEYDAKSKDAQIKILAKDAQYKQNMIWTGSGIFVLFLLSGFLLLRDFFQKKKNAELLQAKEMEVIETKERLFTNITHELRTPLSLIISPLREIEEEEKNQSLREKATLALDNSQQLLSLVDQILDWHSLDAKMLKNTPHVGEVCQVVRQSIKRFEDAAERKNIMVITNLPEDECYGRFDFDKFQKILNNLLSNAIKYSPEGKEVNVNVLLEDNQIQLQVVDQGLGIPIDKQKEIFERFSRIGVHREVKGSGIGLSIVKELVDLMNGKIEIDSDPTRGSSIKVEAPFKEIKNVNPVEEFTNSVLVEDEDEKPVVFLVEDNLDLRDYLTWHLQKRFEVKSFVTAEAADEAMIEILPDLMVLDVMLPQMDGISFCKKIKNNTCTSHVPVLMLTAKPATKNKVEAIEAGVDVWMNKPFEVAELMVQIENILKSRRALQKKYERQLSISSDVDAVEIEDDLLQKISSHILEKIADDKLSVEDLVKVSGMNRTTMSKKIKVLSGKTPVQLIRFIRLEKAKLLLLKNGKNISEIAFDVGFKDPNYFSVCFKEHFGMSPSEIKKSAHEN